MKNQYIGDVNDFVKYGLLRALTEHGKRRATVAWMLTPDDSTNDGRKLDYLNNPSRWRRRDPELFDALHVIVRSGRCRTVAAVESTGVLQRANFVADYVPRAPEQRALHSSRILSAAKRSDLVFFDPDNGLEVPSRPLHRKHGVKYLAWSELAKAYADKHSVLVYQHCHRRNRDEFITDMVMRFRERTEVHHVFAFETSGVVFFLAAQPSSDKHYRRTALAIADTWRDVIMVKISV